MLNFPASLKFDPSWELFSTKTSSSENSGVESETRNYYYYDQINAIGQLNEEPRAVWFSVLHGNRQRLSEQQSIQKGIHDDKYNKTSTFYEYSDEWNTIDDMLPIQTIQVDTNGLDRCDEINTGNMDDLTVAEIDEMILSGCSGSTVPPCGCIKTFSDDVPAGYYRVP